MHVSLVSIVDIRGVVHQRWQKINKEYYVAISRRLGERVRRVRPELGANNSWILNDDNVRSPSYKHRTVQNL